MKYGDGQTTVTTVVVALQPWFSLNLSIKQGHKTCSVYVCMYVCIYLFIFVRVCVSLIKLYIYIYISIYYSSRSYVLIFCRDIFRFTLTVNALWNISQQVSPCSEELWNIFGLNLSIFLNVLRILKYSLDIFLECIDTTVVVKNVLGFSLLWSFLGVFGPFCTRFLK